MKALSFKNLLVRDVVSTFNIDLLEPTNHWIDVEDQDGYSENVEVYHTNMWKAFEESVKPLEYLLRSSQKMTLILSINFEVYANMEVWLEDPV